MDVILPSKRKAPLALQVLFAFGLYGALLGLYAVAAKPAIAWVIGEIGSAYLMASIGAMAAGYAGLVWRFGWPAKYLSVAALALLLFCAFGARWSFAILPQLSASFALLGLYSFFAGHLRLSGSMWRGGFIMAGLAAFALPFALVPGTGLGFYLRLVTADAAAQILAILGHSSLAAHDVLIFDNGIAQVDLPCSGLKSLFVGTGFYCVASLILRRAISVKWMMGYAIFAGLLIVVNTVRVTVLIWVSEIFLQRGLAETIHMPLGLMLFCLACLFAVLILLKLPSQKVETLPSKKSGVSVPFRAGASIAAAILLVCIALLFPAASARFTPKITPPMSMQLIPVELTQAEDRFFGARARTAAGKWMFDYEGLSGSMLVVHSGAVNGLHAPEVCLLGNGISVDQMKTVAAGDSSYRFLTVDQNRRNAVYWMQSQDIVTDDFRVRFKKYALGGQADWVMVTILLDQRLSLSSNSAEGVSRNEALLTLMDQLQGHYKDKLKE